MKNAILGKMMLCSMLGLFVAAPMMSRAEEQHTMNMMQAKVPAEFNKLKQLVGTWTGTMPMNGKQMDYTVTYELTAGGTALLEKEFAGTPHEMLSVYYPQGNGVVVTHYCMLGNQPHMTLTKSSGNTMNFVMQGHSGLRSPSETHMHALNLTFVDDNHIVATWVQHEKGKKNHDVVMELTRKS